MMRRFLAVVMVLLGFGLLLAPATSGEPSPGHNCPNPAGNLPPGQCKKTTTTTSTTVPPTTTTTVPPTTTTTVPPPSTTTTVPPPTTTTTVPPPTTTTTVPPPTTSTTVPPPTTTTVAGAPGAPTAVAAVSDGPGQATVTWSIPFDNGSPISHYTVTPFRDGIALTPVQVDWASSTSVTITGLPTGIYTFEVTATNMMGTSPPGTSNSVAVA